MAILWGGEPFYVVLRTVTPTPHPFATTFHPAPAVLYPIGSTRTAGRLQIFHVSWMEMAWVTMALTHHEKALSDELVATLTTTDWSGDVTQTRCLQVVCKWVWACTTSTRLLGPHRLCWVGRCHSHASKTNVNHGCARSSLKPCSTNSNRSIQVSLSQTLAASRSRSTLSVGSRAKLRLGPIVLIPQALPSCSSQHRHPCRIPCWDGSAITDTSLSAVFVRVGSLTTIDFLSSCFAWSHKSLVAICLRGPRPLSLDDAACCCWIDSQSELDRHSQEFQESELSQCCWHHLEHSTRGTLSIKSIPTPVCICVCTEMFRIFALPYHDSKLLCSKRYLPSRRNLRKSASPRDASC